MKPRFNDIESYQHYYAKLIVKKWIEINPKLVFVNECYKVKIEEKHCSLGFIDFIPDLTVYSKLGVNCFVEIFHKHELTDEKLDKIEAYCKSHNWGEIHIVEIDADWVMNQIRTPETLVIKKLSIIE